jgi:hypothetical protein
MPRREDYPGFIFGAASKNRTSWTARNVVRASLPRWSGTVIASANQVVQVAISGGAPFLAVMGVADLRNGYSPAGISSLHGPGFQRVLIQLFVLRQKHTGSQAVLNQCVSVELKAIRPESAGWIGRGSGLSFPDAKCVRLR